MIRVKVKEEYAIILDYLPNGYPFDTKPGHLKIPVAQAVGKNHFMLLELVPKKGSFLSPNEEVYMGEGKRDKIHHITGRIPLKKLTQTAKAELDLILKTLVRKHESRFVEFFNRAGPINARRHQLELLPGIGKKHMWEILEARKEKLFTSLEDIRARVKLLPDPEKSIIRRILQELEAKDKYKLFIGS